MCYKLPSGNTARIVTVHIAFDARTEDGWIADELSALLSESGSCNPGSGIIDWMHTGQWQNVKLPDDRWYDLEEGEVFIYIKKEDE